MRSSSYFLPSSPKKGDKFVLGPIIYPDTMDDADTSRSRRLNRSFTDQSRSPYGSLTFHSPTSSTRTKTSKRSRAKKSSEASKKSKKGRKCDFSIEACPIKREERDAEYLAREKSEYERSKRAQIMELARKAEQDHDKLMVQRTRAQQTAKEIESSMNMEQDSRNRSMALMKSQLEGMDWRSSRDLKDVRKEMEQWKEKTAMSGELAKRVDSVEKRVDMLERTDAERKKTMEMVEKNWAEFGRLKTQSMALEITQISNRRGAQHLARMPKEVAATTSRNLYKLCADLHRLTFHLNHKSDLTRLVDEALTLAEALAPLFGAKEDFIDSRENTSCTDVSLSSHATSGVSSVSTSGSTADSSTIASGGSAPTSPNSKLSDRTPIRSSLRRVGRDPAAVSIPPLSKFDPKYSTRDVVIDAPSLREKSSNYYSDKEFTNISKETQANCEPGLAPQVAPIPATVAAPVVAAAAAPPAAPEMPATPTPAAAASPVESPSPASISLSVDSERDSLQKEKKRTRKSLEESKPTEEETQ